MKAHLYLAIFVRLFAIALFLYAIKQSSVLVEWLMFGRISAIHFPVFTVVMSVLMPLVLSIFLWLFPVIVSRSIVKTQIDVDLEPSGSKQLFLILIAAIGLFGLFYASVDLVYYFSLWQYANSLDDLGLIDNVFTADVKSNVWATLFELSVSVMLVLKSRTIASKIILIAE